MSAQKAIYAADRAPTPHYWFQGRALTAARKHFTRGEWGDYLRACHVSQDQARDARKLAWLYDSPEALVGLSVREALRLAKGEASHPDTIRLLRHLAVRLKNAVKAAGAIAQKAETSAERAALAKSIEQTLAALNALAGVYRKGESS